MCNGVGGGRTGAGIKSFPHILDLEAEGDKTNAFTIGVYFFKVCFLSRKMYTRSDIKLKKRRRTRHQMIVLSVSPRV